jgi:dsDNA-specific endonuclease/ATPase MutS2
MTLLRCVASFQTLSDPCVAVTNTPCCCCNEHTLLLLQDMQSHSQIVKNISACVSEDGDIRDSASDEVRQSRGKLRAVENRLKAILKGHSGEISEMVRDV